MGVKTIFGHAADHATKWSGSAWAFGAAALVILAWALTGPIFGFSDTWQLVINTGTTIVTFLMVFLIQHSQNKDTAALHLKLNELIAAVQGASNNLIDIEDMDADDLERLHLRYQKLAEQVKARRDACSVDEVEDVKASRGPSRPPRSPGRNPPGRSTS